MAVGRPVWNSEEQALLRNDDDDDDNIQIMLLKLALFALKIYHSQQTIPWQYRFLCWKQQ
jgi:hypothetical protein